MKKKILFVLIALSILGLIDAGYLTYEHYRNIIPPCSMHTWFSDCGAVLSSKYATIMNIPVALLGAMYYVAFGFLCLLLLRKQTKLLSIIFYIVATLGGAASLTFIFLQFFVLHAICPYCMLSDTNLLVMFGLVVSVAWNQDSDKEEKRITVEKS